MSGGHDLTTLLRGMNPVLDANTFVFATVKGPVPAGLTPQMVFQEAEGTTLILTQAEAEAAHIPYEFPCRMITLNIHSALEAVGFLARVSIRLAALNMGVNPVAGFYHDHLFIPEARAEAAIDALHQMAAEADTP
ncbi:ACT domain-containing protein [Roseovarius sp. LXJ103]|uniref:ACT domain-containing protein n=1 Tax=Roseovarius carneus TaxID=2853164 RepID=UPI000D607DB8|nr:ACT domain-containing protein [Roseovarius carneus]MBZ8118751.1 ACT domain-containing protein [Roseovarius carneus]PWE35575.1 ribonuclease H family protein [Pelagicola sp. LXJ1103]